MSKPLFDVQRINGVVFIKEDRTPQIALTDREAIDMIRALSCALMDEHGSYFTVKRDTTGRGER